MAQLVGKNEIEIKINTETKQVTLDTLHHCNKNPIQLCSCFDNTKHPLKTDPIGECNLDLHIKALQKEG